uniref:Uncharacterized protein n=1 Tax=Anguilla anguilla TaxID=7936 RepID=A0A0E9QVI1_ANGAN
MVFSIIRRTQNNHGEVLQMNLFYSHTYMRTHMHTHTHIFGLLLDLL